VQNIRFNWSSSEISKKCSRKSSRGKRVALETNRAFNVRSR
jgi:hypothetical protein